jgi:limonene-1,2-epoxide hydrolase
LPVIALEYLEHDSTIFVSFYIQDGELANYLILISADGKLLLNEKLDEHLKGIGMGTFFVLSGCVFFVKNKVELVSYRIV